MAKIYYKDSNEESVYALDDTSQQMLVYLSSTKESSLADIVNNVGAVSESGVRERITEQMGPEAAELIAQSDNTQRTLGGSDSLTYYELTEDGRTFVAENKAVLSMPADFKDIADTIGELRSEVVEMRDSMHRVDADELSEQLSTLSHRLDRIQSHISNYE